MACRGKNCDGNCDNPRRDCNGRDDNGLECCCLNHIQEADLCCFTYMDCPYTMLLCAIPLLVYCICQKCCSTSKEGGEKSEDSPPYQEME